MLLELLRRDDVVRGLERDQVGGIGQPIRDVAVGRRLWPGARHCSAFAKVEKNSE